MSYRIREARKAAQITQADLASKLGINRATLSKYESGSIVPSVPQLRKIAQALQIEDWTDLVSEEEKGQVIINHMKDVLSDSKGKFQKASPSEMHNLGILRFNSEKDRIAYFYSLLNTDGKLTANRCFYQHLNPDTLTEVADYVQKLSEISQYQNISSPSTSPEDK